MAKAKNATTTMATKKGGKRGKPVAAVHDDAVSELPSDDLPTTHIHDEGSADKPLVPSAPAEPAAVDGPAAEPSAEAAAEAPTPTEAKPAKGKKQRTPKAPKPSKEKKLSAIDAAAELLEMAGQPMNCVELIEAMDRRGLWSSPNGKTPAATLYSAILREINTKGKASRFMKAERGMFARR